MNSAGADNTTPILLALKNICRTFPMGDVPVEALRDVSLEIQRGELLAVVGPSGSGKSTILNLIGGLDQPTAGTIWYDGRDLSESTAAELTAYRRKEVGFIFQFYNLVPTLTVAENVRFLLDLDGAPDAEARAQALLEEVELADRGDAFPDRLSGGEQQRVAIARALAHDPGLVLADEPTGDLDARTGARILDLLERLTRERGRSLLMVTHDDSILDRVDAVYRLADGHVTREAGGRA